MIEKTVLDLFAGIGGFSLGLHRAGGYRTEMFCEVGDFQQSVLCKHWPNVPIHADISTLNGKEMKGRIDVITGGFPCQAHSTAAHGHNTAKDWWPEMARVVSEVHPRYVIAENVQRKPIAIAADFFCSLGMQCDVFNLPASAIGADHERSRWWAIAHPYKNGELPRYVHAEASRMCKIRESIWGAENYRAAICLSDGIPRRLDDIKAYGNAVLPQIPEIFGRAINQMEALS
jgi:DNA (cytosine-5)-methyltransferase 1